MSSADLVVVLNVYSFLKLINSKETTPTKVFYWKLNVSPVSARIVSILKTHSYRLGLVSLC